MPDNRKQNLCDAPCRDTSQLLGLLFTLPVRDSGVLQRIASLLRYLPAQSRFAFSIVLYGMVGGLVAVAFQAVVNWLWALAYVIPAREHPDWFPWTSLGTICAASLISGWMLTRLSPEAAGSGIPQLKLAFWKEFGTNSVRLPWVKFIASAISIGGGNSLGREGPSVQLGGSAASTLAGWLGVAKQRRRTAAATGAAAGLAAAFNAPLAAVAFVLEEVLEDLNSRLLGPVLLAAVTGAFVVHAFFGAQPAFELPRIDEPTWRAYVVMPFCAGLAALAGIGFQKCTLGLRSATRRSFWKKVPPMWRPLLGGLVTWAWGMLVFRHTGHLGVFSLGYDDLSTALAGGLGWKIAFLLLVTKLLATSACYGLGGAGGIFSPSLFFGGMCGVVAAALGSSFLDLNTSDSLLLGVGGMCACLGGVVQAPVTAVLIIFEMTHQFALVPGLMLATLISQLITRRLSHHSFYETVLAQDGHTISHIVPPRDLQRWQELPISAIAHFAPITVDPLALDHHGEILNNFPFRRFPAVSPNGEVQGLVLRQELISAVKDNRHPVIMTVPTVTPSESVRACQRSLIDSDWGMVIVVHPENHQVLAVVTLHDLLRAQTAASERDVRD